MNYSILVLDVTYCFKVKSLLLHDELCVFEGLYIDSFVIHNCGTVVLNKCTCFCFRWLVNHMMDLGFSKSLSEWIGSNLKKSGDHETWAFNLEGAVQMFNSYW